MRKSRTRTLLFPLACSIIFLFAASVLIPRPGLQNDEALFAMPLVAPRTAFYSIEAGHKQIPFMVMSYIGALKTWFYFFVFRLWQPSAWSVRLPVTLACIGAIWLTWIWVRAIAGLRAAIASTALLATDTIFLLTGVFDWGPVAFQHLLLMGGLVCVTRHLRRVQARDRRLGIFGQSSIANAGSASVVRAISETPAEAADRGFESFGDSSVPAVPSDSAARAVGAESGAPRALALGFFLWGLGLWNKALFVWPLAGIALAAVCVYPRETIRRITLKTVSIAVVSFLAGAAPLVWFNIDRRGQTVTANAAFSTGNYGQKIEVLRQSLNGSALLGYMVEDPPGGRPRAAHGPVERASLALRRLTGPRLRNWFLPAFAIAFVSLFWLRRSPAFRPMLFVLIAAFLTWLQMFATRNAGAGSHHIVLIWPLPFVFTGIALAEMSRRIPRYGAAVLAASLVLLAGANLLTTNEYLARFIMRGGILGWTDAIYPLSASLGEAEWTGAVDWGYINGLELLHHGRMKLFDASEQALKPQLNEADLKELRKMVTSPTLIFVEHTEANQMFPGVNAELRRRAADFGYAERVEAVIKDSAGVPIFEIFRFAPDGQNASVRF
jgi:hypothetical protein